MTTATTAAAPSREQQLHSLHEAAEPAHHLMCQPTCDGSHHGAGLVATGEARTGLLGVATDMPAQRDGAIALAMVPEPDGPLQRRGALEGAGGTGRMVCRMTQAWLCRCGGSPAKPFCDGSHTRNGFRAE